MLTLLTCNGYQRIATLPFDADAPAACRKAESERNDNYAVIAMRDGRLVADADGWVDDDAGEDHTYQAQYAYACGYRD